MLRAYGAPRAKKTVGTCALYTAESFRLAAVQNVGQSAKLDIEAEAGVPSHPGAYATRDSTFARRMEQPWRISLSHQLSTCQGACVPEGVCVCARLHTQHTIKCRQAPMYVYAQMQPHALIGSLHSHMHACAHTHVPAHTKSCLPAHACTCANTLPRMPVSSPCCRWRQACWQWSTPRTSQPRRPRAPCLRTPALRAQVLHLSPPQAHLRLRHLRLLPWQLRISLRLPVSKSARQGAPQIQESHPQQAACHLAVTWLPGRPPLPSPPL